jgi:hypothetical protein
MVAKKVVSVISIGVSSSVLLRKKNRRVSTGNCLFVCEVRSLPFTYLEVPIHHRKLTNKEQKNY